MPHDVVISYSRRNREVADRFVELLRGRGLDRAPDADASVWTGSLAQG